MKPILRTFLLQNAIHFVSGFVEGTIDSTQRIDAQFDHNTDLPINETHYETLGVVPTASHDEIVEAFRREIKRWHPDLNPSPEATERSRRIIGAYIILQDFKKRAQYDEFIRLNTCLANDKQNQITHEERVKWRQTRGLLHQWEENKEIDEMVSKTLAALLADCAKEAGRYAAARLWSILGPSRRGG